MYSATLLYITFACAMHTSIIIERETSRITPAYRHKHNNTLYKSEQLRQTFRQGAPNHFRKILQPVNTVRAENHNHK